MLVLANDLGLKIRALEAQLSLELCPLSVLLGVHGIQTQAQLRNALRSSVALLHKLFAQALNLRLQLPPLIRPACWANTAWDWRRTGGRDLHRTQAGHGKRRTEGLPGGTQQAPSSLSEPVQIRAADLLSVQVDLTGNLCLHRAGGSTGFCTACSAIAIEVFPSLPGKPKQNVLFGPQAPLHSQFKLREILAFAKFLTRSCCFGFCRGSEHLCHSAVQGFAQGGLILPIDDARLPQLLWRQR